MKHETVMGIFKCGVIVAGAALTIGTPSLAQRVRGGDDKKVDKQDDSRPASRPETRSESRSAPRQDRPVFRAPEPRDSPRFSPSPQPFQRNGPRELPQLERLQRSTPTATSPGWRGGSNDRRSDNGGVRPSTPTPRPDPVWRDTPRSSPGDSSPTWRGTPPDRNPDNGGVKPSVPNSATNENPSPGWRDSGARNLPERNRPSGGLTGRGSRGTASPDTGSVLNRPGKSPQDIARGGELGRRLGSPDRPSGSAPAGWRPPSRSASGSGTVARGNKGARDVPSSGGIGPNYRPRTTGMVKNVPTHRGYRPPDLDRNRWSDGGRRYGGRYFNTIDLGWYDPWYHYNGGFYSGARFYYPFYYCGPFSSGYYYSPFWCYGNWAPVYIYPERVIYVERRVYLHDVVDDDYDLYSSSGQSSMRDTMEDIRSAWLDGEGGRLLDHVNQAIPIRIYQKGVYKYSLDPEDFRDVTKDALNRVQTSGFEWTNMDKVSADETRLEARHTFLDPDGERHVIRITYTIEKARGGWWITETGTEKWASDV